MPETIFSSQTSDIFPWEGIRWYDWYKFWDQEESFPEYKDILGRWLVPSLDVGPAITLKVLKSNRQLIHVSNLRPLNKIEEVHPDHIKERGIYDDMVKANIGGPVDPDKLAETDP